MKLGKFARAVLILISLSQIGCGFKNPLIINGFRKSFSNMQNTAFPVSVNLDIFSTISPVALLFGTGSLFGAIKLSQYFRLQTITASIIGGIPKNYKVVEIDAQDGKNIFYLPDGIEYTAIMNAGGTDTDNKKVKDKMKINEQLILESIGGANRNEGRSKDKRLTGKVRLRTQEIPNKSVDCVLSTGAIKRSEVPVEIIKEAYRMLRPGGVFVFVESEPADTLLNKIYSVFPKTIKETTSDKVEKKNAKSLERKKGVTSNKRGATTITSTTTRGASRSTLELEVEELRNVVVDNNIGEITTTTDTASDTSTSGVTTSDKNTAGPDIIADTSNNSRNSDTEIPGVKFEEVSNVFEKLVSGIAVRP